jgi:hypothetical protein
MGSGVSFKPADATKAREALLGIIERATERLTSKAEAHRVRAELQAALATDLLAFDVSPEGERLRRYELAHGRGVAGALDLLQKHRRTANGPFISSGYATTNQPTFDGTAAAYAIVQLFARPLNVDAEVPLGETVADSSGNWSLATGPLAAGGYIITAKVTPPAGYASLMMALTSNNGTFFIDLAQASAVANSQPTAVAADTSRPFERSKTRNITLHRTPKTPRERVARSAPSDRSIR